jgi:hypothetical protein
MRIALAFIFIFVGCTEVILNPTSVDVSVTGEGVATEVTTGAAPSENSMRLTPDSMAITVGSGAVVKVEVFDIDTGQELSSSERGTVSYSIADSAIAAVTKADGRWITIGGLAEGDTSVLFTAAGVSATLSVQVSP